MKRMFGFTAAALMGLLSLAPLAEAGRVGGQWHTHGVVHANHTMVYDGVVFKGGREASVAVSGDGPMRLEIYDNAGDLVASNYSHPGPQGQECEIDWQPDQTASFTVKIVNLNSDAPDYYDDDGVPHWPYNYNNIMYGVASN